MPHLPTPVYPYTYLTNATCFSFKMKMDGTGMGSLELYMLQENEENFEKPTPIARFVGNQVSKPQFYGIWKA